MNGAGTASFDAVHQVLGPRIHNLPRLPANQLDVSFIPADFKELVDGLHSLSELQMLWADFVLKQSAMKGNDAKPILWLSSAIYTEFALNLHGIGVKEMHQV